MQILGVEINGTSEGLARSLQAATGDLTKFDRAAGTVTANVSRNLANLSRVNFSGFHASLKAGEVSLGRLAASAQKVTPALAAAGSAVTKSTRDFTGLSRVIQDLPFGFIGIQNNLTQLLPSAGLLGLGISALVSAITFAQTGTDYWTRGLKDNKKALDNSKKGAEEYLDSLNQLDRAQLKGTQNAQQEIVELKTLYDQTQNVSLSNKTRKEAVDDLQKQYPSYFKNIRDEVILAGGAKAAYEQLATAIIATAQARAAQDLIVKNSTRKLENEQKVIDLEKEQIKNNAELIKQQKLQNAANQGTSSLTSGAGSITAAKKTYDATKKIEDTQRQINNLKTDSSLLDQNNLKLTEAITNRIKQGADLTGAVGGIDETKDKTVSLADILKDLNKALEKAQVQFGSTFGERNQEQIAAYQSAIDAATDAFGRQSKAVKDLQAEQKKLFQLSDLPTSPSAAAATLARDLPRNSKGGLTVLPDLANRGLPAGVDKEQLKTAKEFGRLLERSVDQFGTDFFRTISTINQRTDASFESIFADLSASITSIFQDVFLKQLTDTLIESIKKAKQANTSSGSGDDDDGGSAKLAAALGIGGALISGSTKKTSTAGQGIGGALTGAGIGTAIAPGIGTVIGGLIGGIAGIFGSKKARKEEELQKKQLAEQEKQTKLLERQNAQAYTSSIIGRMTQQGVVTSVDVNEYGQLTTKISGSDLVIIADRANNARTRGR